MSDNPLFTPESVLGAAFGDHDFIGLQHPLVGRARYFRAGPKEQAAGGGVDVRAVLALAALIVEIAAWRAHSRQLAAAAQATATARTLTAYAATLPFPPPPPPAPVPVAAPSATRPPKTANGLGPRPAVRTQPAPHQRPRTR